MRERKTRPASVTHWGIVGSVLIFSLGLYTRTLAPSVATLFDDSLEFQVVIPLLGIPHPPGYPLYTILGKAWVTLLPLRDAAWRLNSFSALWGALTVSGMYLLVYTLLKRHWTALAAIIMFALAPTFWQMATIAEVYTLHTFFMIAVLVLILPLLRKDREAKRYISWLSLTLGLALAHHRMTFLLFPTVAYALWVYRPYLPRTFRFWLKIGALFVLPMALYAYIPLVGARVGSLDGTYTNTWQGFWNWVLARDYRVFLTGNPFNVHRTTMDYIHIAHANIGWVGLALVFLGLFARPYWPPRVWTAWILALGAHMAFVWQYKVTDIEVFFLPIILLMVLPVAVGLHAVEQGLRRVLSHRIPGPRRYIVLTPLITLLLLMPVGESLHRTRVQWGHLDRSDDWEVYDWGADIVSQPLPTRSVIVGILGETTLIRYFRDVLGKRPDIVVHPADKETDRLHAIAAHLARKEAVYITRPLTHVGEYYALDAEGPLIRVRPKNQDDRPRPGHPLNHPFTEAIHLAGYDIQWRTTHRGTVARVTLYWDVLAHPREAYKISARLLRPDGNVAAAVDDVPVHNTYPTTQWSPGERVVDVYDIPRPTADVHSVLIILYRARDGNEVARVLIPL